MGEGKTKILSGRIRSRAKFFLLKCNFDLILTFTLTEITIIFVQLCRKKTFKYLKRNVNTNVFFKIMTSLLLLLKVVVLVLAAGGGKGDTCYRSVNRFSPFLFFFKHLN
jgi:hypothetical protein